MRQASNNYILTPLPSLTKLFLQVFLLLFTFKLSDAQSISLSLSSTTINTNSVYNFEIFDGNLASFDGTITIQFNAVYFTITDGSVSIYSTGDPSSTYTYTTLNNNKVNINYVKPTQVSPLVKLSIASLQNPSSTVSVTFNYKFSTGGTQLSTSTRTTSPYTPASLQSCSITFNPSYTHTEATMSVSMALKTATPAGSTIYITFPSYWQNSYAISAYKPVIYSSTTCNWIQSQSYLSSSPTCVKFSDQIIYIDAGIISAATSGSTIKFTMTGILSPATVSPNNLVTLSTTTSDGATVDSSACSVTTVSPQSLTLSTTSTFTVGKGSEPITFSWITNSPIIINDIISMAIPENYIQYGTVSPWITYNSATLIGYSSTATSSLTYQFKVTKVNESTTGTYYVAPLNKIEMSFIYVKNLIDTSPRSIVISVSRNSYKIAEGSLTITPGANALTSPTLTSTISTVSSSSSFTFQFTLSNSIPTAAGTIQIQVPASIQLSGSQPDCTVSSTTNSQSLSGAPSCSISSRTITLSSFLSGALPTAAKLSITVNNALINPLTTEPTSTFVIKTISSNNYVIDQNSALTYTATADVISSFTITPSSYVVGADTIYTFVYTLNKKLPAGSQISITLPVSVTTLATTTYSYTLDSGSSTSTVPTVTTSGSNTVLTFTSIVSSDLVSGTVITIKADSLHNPESLKPTQSFTISVKSSTGYSIQSVSSGKIITMQTLATFSELTPMVSTTEKINGASTDYTFYFKTLIDLKSGFTLILEIIDSPTNNALSFSSTVDVCEINTPSTALANTCLLSNNQLTITLSGDVDASETTQYRLVVSSITLARTMDTTSKFRLTAYTGIYGILQSTVSGLTNTLTNEVQAFSLNVLTNPSQLNQIQQFSLTFTLFNKIYFADGEYLILQLPTTYTFIGSDSSPNLCTNSNLNCTIYDTNNLNSVKIASTSISTSTTTLTFTFNTNIYVSPKDFGYQNDYFYITSYSASGKKIDETSQTSTPVAFDPTCNDYCKTCRTTDASYCLTCYSLNSGYDITATYSEYIYMTTDNNCVNQCGNGYFNNSVGTCAPCSSPCATCSSTASSCLSCVDTFYFDNDKSECVIECPEKTYEDDSTNACETCSTSCFNCTTNSVTCTSCNSGKYLLNSVCTAECGYGYYEDSITGTCKTCNAGCDGCTANATDCVQCKSGYYLESVSSTKCVSDCPDGTVKNTVSGICECGGSCDTCTGTLTNCTSCANGSAILYDNACISDCPAQTYSTGTTCLPCKDQNCLDCTASQCQQCSTGYLLYNGLCAESCPDGTYKTPNDYTCSLCSTGCKLCLTDTLCQSCYGGFLIEGSACVTTCSDGFINYNATICLTQCPTGYINETNRCVVEPEDPTDTNNTDTNNNTNNNNNTNTTNTTNTTEEIPTFVPFPFTISYVITTAIAGGMKCVFSPTLLPVAIMSFGSILEVFSAATLVAVGFVEDTTQTDTDTTNSTANASRLLQETTATSSLTTPLIILISAIGLLFVLNIVHLILVSRYLQDDPKFAKHYKKSKSGFIFIRIISTITIFKFHQIIFSNILGCKVFRAKVQFVNRLFVFNILLIFSIIWAILVIAAAGIISYEKQDQLLFSATFIQSIDCVIIIILNIIPTVLVLRRKEKDYNQEIKDEQGQRYETNDELNFNQDESGEGMEEGFVQTGGAAFPNQSRLAQSRKDYFYKNNHTPSGFKDNDIGDGPLSKRVSKKGNPIKEKGNEEEHSSAALMMKGSKNQQSKVTKLGDLDENEQIQEITLEEPVRDNMINPKRKNNGNDKNDENQKNQKHDMSNYTGYDLDPKLLTLSEQSPQFKKLPAQIKSKIRLAKANMQINKNSTSNLKNQTIGADLEQIQLSPKKKKKIGANGEEIIVTDQSEIEKSGSKSKSKSKLSRSKSKEKSLGKSKSKSKEKIGSSLEKKKKNLKPNEISLLDQAGQSEEQGAPGTRLNRNRSEQMKKKQLQEALQIKTTKSQNIKKRKKKVRDDKNNVKIRNNADNGQIEDDEEYGDEPPSLPVFKAKKKKNQGSDQDINNLSDGLTDNEKNSLKRMKSGVLTDRQKRSQSNQRKKIRNRSNSNGNHNQQGEQDNMNQIHSDHISNLIIKNKSLRQNNNSLMQENDDESIYKKIYNDETETLKSLQNDLSSNYFNHEISPSQFNYQNQRFDETDISQNQNLPEKPIVHIQGLEVDQDDDEDDGLDGQPKKPRRFGRYDDEPSEPTVLNRYSSQQNIADYDSVLSRRVNNEKIKQLQKIYLPRLQVKKPSKRK